MTSQTATAADPSLSFLIGGGDMAVAVEGLDPLATPLGDPRLWPAVLKATVQFILPARAQIVLFWGEEFIALYNDAYVPTIGTKHPGALGRPARENWSELWDDLGPLLQRVRDTGETYEAKDRPFRISRFGREEQVWFDVSYQAVREEGGAIAGVLCLVNETTQHVLTERRLKRLVELDDRIRDLTDPADISYAAGEILGRTLEVSRAGYGTIDLDEETITIERDWNAPGVNTLAGMLRFRDFGSYIDELKRGVTVVLDDAETDPRTLGTAEALRSISVQSFVNMPLTERGGLVALVYLNHDSARSWSADELDFLRQVAERARDAVERRRAEQGLFESDARFRAITNSIDQMIWSTQPDGFHDYYNDRWYEFTGVPAGSTDGEAWNGMFHPDDQERAWTLWRASLQTGAPYHIEYRLRHRSGEYRWVIGRAQCVRDASGAITRWYGTCTDIHDLKTAEEALRELNETLEQRVTATIAEREQMAAALRQAQKMEALGQLTGGVAHDFNNLLQVVVGNLEILQRNLPEDPPRLRRSADNAMVGATRAATLTQRLLAFSRRQPLAPQPVAPNTLVTGMAELLTRTLGETIELETVQGAGLWRVEADPNQLESAILNLAVNARDAMPSGGKLTIETSNARLDEGYVLEHVEVQPGQYVMISVSDTGSGMEKETVTRAFEPFFTTKEVGKGTGLGLSMVYGFVKQSGGHVKIYSEIASGTSVKIYLPRLMGEEPDVAAAVEQIVPDGSRYETILVVEDDDDVRMYSVEVLRELGYRVLEAYDAASAIRLLERQEGRVDLLFTDVVLPGGVNGEQLSQTARAMRPDIKVLFTTGYARNAIVHHGRLDRGVELITKPFTYVDLAARVRDVLDGRPGRAGL